MDILLDEFVIEMILSIEDAKLKRAASPRVVNVVDKMRAKGILIG